MENLSKIEEFAQKIKNVCGYQFKNLNYLSNAFTPRTSQNNHSGNNYEISEFIGDKVIGISIVKLLVDYFNLNTDNKSLNVFKFEHIECFETLSDEGILTQIEDNFTQGEYLSKRFNELNLNWNDLVASESKIAQNNNQSKSVHECILEAIVGAIALDSNFDYNQLLLIVRIFLNFD